MALRALACWKWPRHAASPGDDRGLRRGALLFADRFHERHEDEGGSFVSFVLSFVRFVVSFVPFVVCC